MPCRNVSQLLPVIYASNDKGFFNNAFKVYIYIQSVLILFAYLEHLQVRTDEHIVSPSLAIYIYINILMYSVNRHFPWSFWSL